MKGRKVIRMKMRESKIGSKKSTYPIHSSPFPQTEFPTIFKSRWSKFLASIGPLKFENGVEN